MHVVSVRTDGDLPSGGVRWADVVDADNAPAELPAVEIDPDEDMCIFYTCLLYTSPSPRDTA